MINELNKKYILKIKIFKNVLRQIENKYNPLDTTHSVLQDNVFPNLTEDMYNKFKFLGFNDLIIKLELGDRLVNKEILVFINRCFKCFKMDLKSNLIKFRKPLRLR